MNKDIKNDWRLTNQETYLKGINLYYHKYKKPSEKWDHDHCEFCMKTFIEDCKEMSDCTNVGYSSLDNYYWICEECFKDFKDLFKWTVTKE